jgi:asparagine synthase (glutamine-hydrolysing)
MCGIAGYIDLEATTSPEALTATAAGMAASLHHRGPDDDGVWVDASAGVALAFQRLSILDLSEAGHQPMRSVSGRYVIVFNGEIYNFQELRGELESSGAAPRWRGHSDTEVVLACLERWGVEQSLPRFNGMFAFAVWDRQERILNLARDRFGEKPLYFGRCGGSFVFASELKALRIHPEFPGVVDRGSLLQYVRFGYVPAPGSIYHGISKLLPASLLRFSLHDRGTRVQPYWSLYEAAENGLNNPVSPDEAKEHLGHLLRDSVRLRMLADVPVGCFLSGGIDSSLITALMSVQSDRPVRTFSIGVWEAAFDESKFAAAVARHLGTDHHELVVTADDALATVHDLPRIYDEPFADSSQIPTLLVSRLARQHVTVALSGDGGDEIFCGYTRHTWGEAAFSSARRLSPALRRWIAQGISALDPATWDSVCHSMQWALPARFRHRLPGQKLHKLATILPAESLEAVYIALASQWSRPCEIVAEAENNAELASLPSVPVSVTDAVSRMSFFDTSTVLPDDMLVKVDRASMSVGLEVRVPLLDHRIVEFAWRLPVTAKVQGVVGKIPLRSALSSYVPAALFDRPKTGFSIPLDSWLRGPLRDWSESLLSERRLREEGYFRSVPIRDTWKQHCEGKRNWNSQLWTVLMFEAWLDEGRRGWSRSDLTGANLRPAAEARSAI